MGPDQGEGGSYLLLPPGYSGDVPDGYHTFTSRTKNLFVFWRAFIDDGETATPVELIEQTRIYPLADRAAPPEMVFPNGSATPADMVFPQDYRYFEMLAEFVEAEAVAPEDMAMRGLMASLGLFKGQRFEPDDHLRDILTAGADIGVKMAKAIRFRNYLPGTRYYEDRQWHNVLNVDARVGMFVIGYSISPATVMNMVGKGSKYPFAYCDVDGNYLSGGRSYRLHLPAEVPAANFWSVTLYDADNASGLDNGQPFPSIGSLDDLSYNDDGSLSSASAAPRSHSSTRRGVPATSSRSPRPQPSSAAPWSSWPETLVPRSDPARRSPTTRSDLAYRLPSRTGVTEGIRQDPQDSGVSAVSEN